MKNITVLGKEYEVRGDGGCAGCLFDPAGMRRECNETPCGASHSGNEDRGAFIVIKEVPVDTPADTQTFTDTDFLAGLPVVGRKDDSGKLDMTLLDDMPRAIKAVVQVMQWAITDKKPTPYERGSWLGVHADRYRAAIARHGRDAAQQASVGGLVEPPRPARSQLDPETNMLHLAHQATSALMALENVLRELEARSGD